MNYKNSIYIFKLDLAVSAALLTLGSFVAILNCILRCFSFVFQVSAWLLNLTRLPLNIVAFPFILQVGAWLPTFELSFFPPTLDLFSLCFSGGHLIAELAPSSFEHCFFPFVLQVGSWLPTFVLFFLETRTASLYSPGRLLVTDTRIAFLLFSRRAPDYQYLNCSPFVL